MDNSEIWNQGIIPQNQWKSLFPIFQHHPELIYLDNAASTQKPQSVIDWVSDFLQSDYANIHRWLYSLSERSEELYYESKCALARLINAKYNEIIYSYNSTYCLNLIAQALINSKKLWKWDKVLLWIREHHSNILPRMTLSNLAWFEVQFINETQDFWIDWDDFYKKFDKRVKVISFSHISNVTGEIMEIKKVREKIWPNTFFIIDGSQSVPHIPIDVQKTWCDAFIMTWHKMMAQTWIGMMFLKQQWIKELNPIILGWWTVKDVSNNSFSLQHNTDKREAWTPNIIWAVSLLKALETIESFWWIGKIWDHESTLTQLLYEGFNERKDKLQILGNLNTENHIWTFSFIPKANSNFNIIWNHFSNNNICIRTWGHCAYPLHKSLNIWWSARISTYLYNTAKDITKFFAVLDEII